jgi:hypothetical protein
MPRRKTAPRKLSADIPPALRAFLETGEREPRNVEIFMLAKSADRLAAVWKDCRREILAGWIREHPASRCWAWWRFDSPEPRKRLGGIGSPMSEDLAVGENLEFGLPTSFLTPFLAAYYRGEARDIHGNSIGLEFRGSDFAGVAIDATDPPTYESEAEYLRRHNLLTPAEIRHLEIHPELLEPEVVTFDEDEDEQSSDCEAVLA